MADVLCPVVVDATASSASFARHSTRARSGEGSVIMLVGEAGIGKSRLARELVKEADAAGMVVLRGRAVPGAAKAPFRPLAEALAPVVDELARAGSTLDPWLPTLAAVVPGLRPPHPGPGDASDAARGESVVRALSSLVDGRRRFARARGFALGGPRHTRCGRASHGQLVPGGRVVPRDIAFRGAQQRS